MSVFGGIDMNEFYSEMSKGELIDRVRRIEKVIGDEHARAEKAEAVLDKIKVILDAPDQFKDREWSDAVDNLVYRLDEIHKALKGGEE